MIHFFRPRVEDTEVFRRPQEDRNCLEGVSRDAIPSMVSLPEHLLRSAPPRSSLRMTRRGRLKNPATLVGYQGLIPFSLTDWGGQSHSLSSLSFFSPEIAAPDRIFRANREFFRPVVRFDVVPDHAVRPI